VYGIVEIPKRFSEDLYRGDQTTVALYSDLGSLLYYKALMLSVNNVVLDMNRDIKVTRHIPTMTRHDEDVQRMPIKYAYVPIYNPQSGFATFLIPPVLMLIIQQTLLLGIGMSMGRARENNMGCIFNADRHYKNPVHIVLGKALVYFSIYFVMCVYMYTFVNKTFALPQLGSYSTLMAFTVPYLLDCIFFSMVFSSFVYRREDCIMLFVFISVPMLFLSGVSWPESNVPAFWRCFSYLFPSTFGMNAYVRINNMGASLSDIAFEWHGIWIQTGAYFLIAVSIYYGHILRLARRGRKE
jgi:ABC-2 type transport system permease protein